MLFRSTERFQRSAQLVAEINGMPGYPFVVIGHPIASDDDAALRVKAELAVKTIVPLLMNRAS